LQRIKEFYPEYADRVGFYAVSYDTTQKLKDIQDPEWVKAGWPWPVAEPVGTMVRDLRIVISSTKIAFDSRGVITYRAGFGEGTDEIFRKVFQILAASG
jgi:hypothetical protein